MWCMHYESCHEHLKSAAQNTVMYKRHMPHISREKSDDKVSLRASTFGHSQKCYRKYKIRLWVYQQRQFTQTCYWSLLLTVHVMSEKMPELVESIHRIVKLLFADIRRALHGQGNYQLA